ncbi:UvrD-helicase domain-containing protein [uncultured Roseibium sp.]|uniref:UvrD-helicase domain-containing protein n=1 Tax=uncultured Roseibium sp. TaxID=1936171 RepID=UPI002608EDB9|nr:UvrD-helicase domain-containing protein [uncultured Roseibium sp.]
MTSASNKTIQRSSLSGLVLVPFGYGFQRATLSESEITFSGRTSRRVAISEVAASPFLRRTLGFAVLVLPLAGGDEIKLAGVRATEAAAMVSAIKSSWRLHFEELVLKVQDELKVLADVVQRLKQPRRYPSACLLDPYLEQAFRVLKTLPEHIPEGTLDADQQALVDVIREFQSAPDALRKRAIDTFIDTELAVASVFLDTIESNPLTPEQRLAVLSDEDATLILAGAGSGKTSVIVAKAANLIRQKIRKPEEILLLAFGKAAAAEMAERIEERSGASVIASTFHALGYDIIREVEKGAPALAPHASDDAQFRALLRDILVNELATQPKMALLILKWFSELYTPFKSEWDFKTKATYYEYIEAHELRTLQGELVKSFEELEIANWLYLNGVAYEYEPDYEHELPENTRKAYTPDFRLTESGLYIEHFGVRKARGPDGETRLMTAPHVDRQSYLDGMTWKRRVHEENGTQLIETYSYERVENRLLDALEEKLKPHVTFNPVPSERVFNRLAEMGQIDAFTQTLGTFLRHFKSSGSSIKTCEARAKISKDKARSLSFLKIFDAVYQSYQKQLGNRIDFEDMIVRATKYVRTGNYQSPFRHLLVDEFQDISEGRAQLLLALKDQHKDARLFAVGDDWQSIYRFTGSDLHLMRSFGKVFGGRFAGASGIHRVVDLGRTFRSVDRIALPARAFVLKNPLQIRKQVIPAKSADKPRIYVSYYQKRKEDHALRSALDDISNHSEGTEISVLLLGRYNFLRPKNFSQINSAYPKLLLRYMTVHGSKGLEADHVVILRADTGRMGFPSEIVDDPLLDLVLPEPEAYDHAEERRLFYVALTRAKKTVTILASLEEPSVFVREMVESTDVEVISKEEKVTAQARCSECGGRMLPGTSKKGNVYFYCEHRRLCGYTSQACSKCGTDIPVNSLTKLHVFECSCGAEFPACPECKDGWLVERSGRYGAFLGCVNFPKCSGKKKIGKNGSIDPTQ